MRSIAIDMGNTRAKAALFEDKALVQVVHGLELSAIAGWCNQQQAQHAIIATVGAPAAPLAEELGTFMQVLLLQYGLPLPINIAYSTPQTLGADRIAAAVGGASLFSGKPVLVFDAGTCLTHEFITRDREYRGGAISPGLHMRLKAMHSFTARLPLAALLPEEEPPFTGQSTLECLQSGAFWGMAGEIENTILRYRQMHPDLQVILCGGDSIFFENKLKEPIFAVHELVLIGLNEILHYNVLQKKSSAPAV